MAKQSKRTRKFASSGGVKSRLQKGTITNKGRVKRKRSGKQTDGGSTNMKQESDSYEQERRQKREDADFVSEKNLGDLDMDSFFNTVGDDNNVQPDMEEEPLDSDDEGDEEEHSDDDEEVEDGDDSEESDEKLQSKSPSKDPDQSDSESEEEDLEEAERRMKEEMGKLQEKDPEFRQFLEENDDALLEYGDEDEVEDEDDDELDAADEKLELPEDNARPIDGSMIRLTPSLLDNMERGAFRSHGIRALKKLVHAFKSACHMADSEEDQDSKGGKKYHVESSEVFDRIMVMSLTRFYGEFHYHLLGAGSKEKGPLHKKKSSPSKESATGDGEGEEGLDANKPILPKTLEKSHRWVDVKPILFAFLKAALHILAVVKEPELVVFVLKSLSDYIPYMAPFPRLAESMLKTLTYLWSAPIDSSEDYQVVRLHAFLRVRQLALTQPFPFIEECLKKLYLAYAQRAKFATASSVNSALPTLTFMGNCVVELYSLDYHSSYQHAFIYIRQLALHLRTAMQKKTPEALGAVYCWQFLHCLKLWVAVLTEACRSTELGGATGEDQLLRSLLFPLSQVILGTVRLIPSTRYLPLRLHCVRLLQQLAAAAEVFLPTTSILLDVFDVRELSQPPKKVNKGDAQPLVLTLRLRADSPLRTMQEMEMCIAEVFVLLNREVELYRYSAGFPEFSVRICQRLRKFSKETRFARWRAYAKGCVDLCERYSQSAMNERAKLNDVAPKDVKQLEVLRPINVPSMGERFTQALEKEKRLEVASRPVQKTSKPQTSKVDDDNEDRPKKKRKVSKKKSNAKLNEHALEQEDELEEGINWSDNED